MPSVFDVLIYPTGPLIKLVADKLAATSVDAPATADLISVRIETERQENEMRRLEAQAKVAQEMAIAARIENAVEVEIEEYFEYAGEGKAGLQADANAVTLGLSGSGKRISKRVVRFTGHSLGVAQVGQNEEQPQAGSDKTS